MKFIYYWLPPIALMTVIFFLSSQQRVAVSDDFIVQFVFFKSLHIIEYGLLYVLTYRALKNTSAKPDWEKRYLAWLIAVFYGISDEVHQVMVPTREGRMRDVFIDAIGATVAMYYLWKLLPKAPMKLRIWAKKLGLSS